jgi:hypothetical protein
MNISKIKNVFLSVAVLAIAIAGFGAYNQASAQKAAKAAPKMSTPTLSSGSATQVSINVTVTAGSTGAPAGFSLQWITLAAYELGPDGLAGTADDNSWPASDSIGLCKASFSGNANLSNYILGPNQSATVNVGEFLFDNGASTNCGGVLVCGTTYVFRAFAHANSTMQRSDFTPNYYFGTLDCDDDDDEEGCTLTQGYWKTHGPTPVGNNEYTWPQAVKDNGLYLGTNNYPAVDLLNIFNTPAQGNGLIALAHQLEAAKLNLANAASAPQEVLDAISAADFLINSLLVPPVGTGSLPSSQTSALTTILANYNEGAIGPGHCD